MSAVIVLAPVITAAWPAVSASVVGAAVALGFAAAGKAPAEKAREEKVELEVEGSACVTGGLARDERLSFVRDGVTVSFARDVRGACSVEVQGPGRTKAELEQLGREFAERVVQGYAYNQVMQELQKRNFAVVQQEVGADRVIHVQVRRFA
jgi:hypothetical protein